MPKDKEIDFDYSGELGMDDFEFPIEDMLQNDGDDFAKKETWDSDFGFGTNGGMGAQMDVQTSPFSDPVFGGVGAGQDMLGVVMDSNMNHMNGGHNMNNVVKQEDYYTPSMGTPMNPQQQQQQPAMNAQQQHLMNHNLLNSQLQSLHQQQPQKVQQQQHLQHQQQHQHQTTGGVDSITTKAYTRAAGDLQYGRKYSRQLNKYPEDVDYSSFDPTLWSNLLTNTETPYQYQIHVHSMPGKSRVETQIKCALSIYPPPPQLSVRLPTDTISRPKFQLKQGHIPDSCLSLEVYIVGEQNPSKPVNLCSRCIKREQKRACRKKLFDESEELSWVETRQRRLAVFNCSEVLEFKDIERRVYIPESGTTVAAKQLVLPLRLACYCRHHGEKKGFRILFCLRDEADQIVGVGQSSTNVMITDDHKVAGDVVAMPSASAVAGSSQPPTQAPTPASSSTAYRPRNSLPLSPTSMEDSSSEFTSDHSHYSNYGSKRRRDGSSISDWSGMMNVRGMDRQSSITSIPEMVGGMSNMTVASASGSATNLAAHNMNNAVDENLPVIKRIIPSQGSIRGGIEVTLLGSGFKTNLVAVFGDNKAVGTHCWSDSTIVTHLPPSTIVGPVVVSFEGFVLDKPQIFTYFDDTDGQLIELALQVVGLKMNGRLEDARNIAMRIVGNNGGVAGAQGAMAGGNMGNGDGAMDGVAADNAVQEAPPPTDHEDVVLRCLALTDIPGGRIANWQLTNAEGQTMVHLASILGYSRVLVALVARGARVDVSDNGGFTPLHFAALFGRRKIAKKLLRCNADPYKRNRIGETVFDVACPHILDLLVGPQGMHMPMQTSYAPDYHRHRRSSSSSTLASIASMQDSREYGFYDHGMISNLSHIPSTCSIRSSTSQFDAEDEWDERDEDDGDFDDDSDEDSDDDSDALFMSVRKHGKAVESPLSEEEERLVRHIEAEDQAVEARVAAGVTINAPDVVSSTDSDHVRSDTSTENKSFSRYFDRTLSMASWDDVLAYIYRPKRTTAPNKRSSGAPPSVRSTRSPLSDHPITSSGDESDRTISAHAPPGGAGRGRSHSSISRMWRYLKNSSADEATRSRSRDANGAGAPPAYEEIFPGHGVVHDKKVGQMAAASAAENSSGPVGASSSSSPVASSSLAPIVEDEEQLVEAWRRQRRSMANDRMLFAFWLPVLLMAIGYMVIKAFGLFPDQVSAVESVAETVGVQCRGAVANLWFKQYPVHRGQLKDTCAFEPNSLVDSALRQMNGWSDRDMPIHQAQAQAA
ncbi:Ankyrin and IPT/TIG repeat-containing protein [Yarrowia sp. C11]|nr:Ankyrin and IPT/TIG repeat-containing protein [Yarrowia sp. E02]KAG5372830.1 Ankyrin and IPT/TIG repeat-containing protein [Yarrowia sp. C11]